MRIVLAAEEEVCQMKIVRVEAEVIRAHRAEAEDLLVAKAQWADAVHWLTARAQLAGRAAPVEADGEARIVIVKKGHQEILARVLHMEEAEEEECNPTGATPLAAMTTMAITEKAEDGMIAVTTTTAEAQVHRLEGVLETEADPVR